MNMLFWVLGFVWVWFVDVKMSDEKVMLANFHVYVYVYFSEKLCAEQCSNAG